MLSFHQGIVQVLILWTKRTRLYCIGHLCMPDWECVVLYGLWYSSIVACM